MSVGGAVQRMIWQARSQGDQLAEVATRLTEALNTRLDLVGLQVPCADRAVPTLTGQTTSALSGVRLRCWVGVCVPDVDLSAVVSVSTAVAHAESLQA